ncbi:MAG: hypothetical protein QXY05_00050 [Candidatus Anstonellales archaeon]
MRKKDLFFLFALLSVLFAQQINITFYYGVGCPHCARTEAVFEELKKNYTLNIVEKEVYQNYENRNEMFALYERFRFNPYSGGVPTTLVNNKMLVIGEMPKEYWEYVFEQCLAGNCLEGVYSANDFSNIVSKPSAGLTWSVLIAAALVDSINPCTLAVMAMLLAVILLSKGRKETLLAGIVFTGTVFVMYLLFGLGILRVVTTSGLTEIFFTVVTVLALVLAIMEINAYFNYKPGFFAVEMPMFLRPYAKKAIEKATSLPGVIVAAVLCSLFLLPCSSGPYLMVLGLLAKEASALHIMYLVVYNLFFVLPMVMITALIVTGYATVQKISETKEKYIKTIHLISGILLLGVFFLMVAHLLGYI